MSETTNTSLTLCLVFRPGDFLNFPELSVPMVEFLIAVSLLAFAIGLLALRRPLYALALFVILGMTRIDSLLPQFGALTPSLLLELVILVGFTYGLVTHRLNFRLIWPETYLLAAFVLFCCLSAALWGPSMYDYLGRLLFKDILVQLFLVLMLMNILREWREVDFMAKAMVLGGMLLAVLSLFHYLVKGGSWYLDDGPGLYVEGQKVARADVLGIHPNGLAVTLCMTLPMLMYFIRSHRSKTWKLLSWIGLPFLILNVALTYSRTGFVVLIFVILMSVTVNRRMQFWLAIAVLVAMIMLLVPSLYWSRIGSLLTDREGSNRIFLYQAALTMIQLNPLIGIGYGGYPHFVDQFYPLVTGYSVVSTPHNIYLEILAETGIVNFLIFGMLFWFLLHTLKRIGRAAAGMEHGEQLTNWTKVLRIGILAHLLAGLTTPNLLATEIYLFIGLALATKKIFADQINHEKLVANRHEKQISIGVAV